MNVRKSVLLVVMIIGLFSMLMACFAGCSQQKYKVDYDGGKMFYEGAKDFYKAGEQVELCCTMIPTDMDISFYLDDEYLYPEYDEKKGYIIRFTMPERDVKLEYRLRNTMTYVPW